MALVVEALEKGDYSDITYEAEIDTDQELDVEGLHSSVFCEAEEARYDKESGEIVDHVVGIDFDVEEAVELWNAAEYGETVEIPLIISEPELTAEKLDELLFRDVLSECETSLWGSTSNRINNVRLATEAVNGTVLLPGEEFDYNPTLGERTAANGYLPAGAYSGGQTVQEYGGGICQVSSMTYYCALYANLKITARTCHYFPVGYLPTGLDATVSWGGPEFRFVNDREYPIRIEAYMKDNNSGVVMKFIGTNVDGSYVKMGVGSWIVYDQTHTDVAVGYKASSTRSVYNADGSLRSQTSEALSHYHYHDEDIQWPEESPSPSPEEPTPSPEEVTPTPTPEEPAPTPEEPAPTPEEPAPTPEVTTPPPAETPVQPEETPAPPVEETPALPPAEESPADPPAEAP